MDFAKELLQWYETHRRHLPWREDPTPYHVLVSEFMLQQTRVDTVLPYYERFLERFPDVLALAESNEEDVLTFWQGLGYYSRARNLRKAAQKIVSDFGGTIPSDVGDLQSLPGVGPYMSHAVAAIAFGKSFIALDGNLARVYSRLTADKDVLSSAGAKRCTEFYLERIDNPSAFNQALMDLGELVCLPSGKPLCDQCPFASFCKAHETGQEMEFPPKKEPPKVRQVDVTFLLVFNGKGEIAVKKRPENGLLASMDEFPNLEGHVSEETLRGEHPELNEIRFLGEATHRFSHLQWNIWVYQAEGALDEVRYVPLSELKKRCSIPAAFSKTLSLLD